MKLVLNYEESSPALLITFLFIAHQLPWGLQVDSVVTLGLSARRMSVVGEERKDAQYKELLFESCYQFGTQK